jgi:hypothetical protein
MTYDLSQLQVIFNVFAISSLTGLAILCALLKRDNDKLAVELRDRMSNGPKPAPKHDQAIAPHEVLAASDENIRQYVSRRSQNWIEPQKTLPNV